MLIVPFFIQLQLFSLDTFPSMRSVVPPGNSSIPWLRPCPSHWLARSSSPLPLTPVLASYWFKKGVREKINRPYEWMKEQYAKQLDWALDRPKLVMLISTLIFAASLCLVPFIGGEFMPHLDEGALWVRATMPYTISFEEASKIAPQIRAILMSYPQVTVVGSELGRPDDGTDHTGFFNCEFYVGSKAL